MEAEDLNKLRPELQRKKWSEGNLYILNYGDGRTFKIGITSGDPRERLNQITQGARQLLPNPLEAELVVSLQMMTNPYYLEQLLHMQLYTNHAGGEWFRLEFHELCELVAQIKPFGILEYYDGWYNLIPDSYPLYIINGVIPHELRYREGVYQSLEAMSVNPSSTLRVDGVKAVTKIKEATEVDAKAHNQEHSLGLIAYRVTEIDFDKIDDIFGSFGL